MLRRGTGKEGSPLSNCLASLGSVGLPLRGSGRSSGRKWISVLSKRHRMPPVKMFQTYATGFVGLCLLTSLADVVADSRIMTSTVRRNALLAESVICQ